MDDKPLPQLLGEVSLDTLERVDVGLEGDWSPSVVTVWSRTRGLIGFDDVTRSHPSFKPSLELYFKSSWLGIHCYKLRAGENQFDAPFATRVIEYIERVQSQT
jgi:hypothetical protein